MKLASALILSLIIATATFVFARTDFHGRPRTAEEVHAMSLANLHGEYASVITGAGSLSLL